MNVHATLWDGLGANRQTLEDPNTNIEIGTLILARIWARTYPQDYEHVATLYNSLGATRVNGYGKTVAAYVRARPWADK